MTLAVVRPDQLTPEMARPLPLSIPPITRLRIADRLVSSVTSAEPMENPPKAVFAATPARETEFRPPTNGKRLVWGEVTVTQAEPAPGVAWQAPFTFIPSTATTL